LHYLNDAVLLALFDRTSDEEHDARDARQGQGQDGSQGQSQTGRDVAEDYGEDNVFGQESQDDCQDRGEKSPQSKFGGVSCSVGRVGCQNGVGTEDQG